LPFCILCPSGFAECLRSWSLLLSLRLMNAVAVRVGEVQCPDGYLRATARPQVPAAARQRSGFVRRLHLRSGESASVLPHSPRTAEGSPSSHPSFPSLACHCHPFLPADPVPSADNCRRITRSVPACSLRSWWRRGGTNRLIPFVGTRRVFISGPPALHDDMAWYGARPAGPALFPRSGGVVPAPI
jgi:hypothetical protein